MSTRSRRTNRFLFAGMGLLIIGVIFAAGQGNNDLSESLLSGKTAVVYRTATCGCCANYIAYLRRAGVIVEEKITSDMTAVKNQFGVLPALTSCHTTRIDDYTVEGHIPAEAIEKLVTEKPTIAGIALPQMPSGSPGMPGAKYGTFDISSFTLEGSSSPYMSI